MEIEGVYVPVVTPFHSDESVDETAYAAAIEFLVDGGVAGVVVGGTTGEYYAMSTDERFAQLELAAHVAAVIDEAGLPVILYNFPARSGVEYGFECMDLLADNPAVIAIKESSGDFSRFLALRKRYEGRIEVMCGSDDQAFDYMAWGVRSWLDGPGNGMPREHVEFTKTMLSGDIELGRRQYGALLAWIWQLEQGNYIQKMKASMTHRGVDVGRARRPLLDLSDGDRAELLAALDESITAFEATKN